VFASLLLAIVAFRFVSHPITTVTIAEKLSGKVLARNWVPLANISTELPLAVIASEDGSFCKNWGVEWRAVRDAIREGSGVGAGLRGASTITMQIAKNLYLWPKRSYVRKMLEVQVAYMLSALWPKKVLMETYLNIAPWGPGIFGAESASQYFFHKSAARAHPSRGNFARRGATQPQSPQSRNADPSDVEGCAGDRQENAGSRLALGLHLAVNMRGKH
jgi:monofunctional glycosyltransferase